MCGRPLLGLVLLLAAGACAESELVPEATSPPPSATTSLPPPTVAPEATTTTVAPATTTTTVTTTTVPPRELRTEPAPGGVVRVGIDANFVFGFTSGGRQFGPSLNPLLEGNTAPEVARLVVPGAYRIDPASGELLPWLVEQIPRPDNGGVAVADDGTVTVTYTVRPEAVWEDGTPVTGADLAFTNELIAGLDDEVLPSDGRTRTAHRLIEPGSVVVDGRSFTATLTAPSPAYEVLFEWVLPAHLIDPDTFVDDWNDRLWPSAGPFRFSSFEESPDVATQPSRIVLERNPNYWETDPATGAELPYLDQVEVLAYTGGAFNPTGAAQWLKTGDLDLGLAGLFRSYDRAAFDDPAGDGYVLLAEWDTLFELIAFNLTDTRFDVNPDSLNQHLAYRQAVLVALDRPALAEASGELAMGSILGVAVPGREHDAWSRYDDPAQASILLAELETELGRDLAAEPPALVYVSSHGDRTTVIGNEAVALLDAAGFDATADFDGDFFGSVLPGARYDVMAIRLFPGSAGLSGVAEMFGFLDPFAGETLFDWSAVGEPAREFSDLVAAAQRELDPDELAATLTAAEAILADTAVLYPLVRRQLTYRPYRPEAIQGYVPHRHQGWDTWNAAWWWSPTG